MKAEVPQYAVQDEIYVDPARTALVVMDMQNDLVKQGGSLLVPDAEGTVAAITRLLELARASGMRVVYTQDTHRSGDPEWEIWPEHCREGSWGWEIITELAPGPDDSVLRKPRYDAFYGTQLDHLLRRLGRRHAGRLRHPRQHLRPIHGGQCRAALVRRRDPVRRDLGARAVRSRGGVAPNRVRVRRALDHGGWRARAVID